VPEIAEREAVVISVGVTQNFRVPSACFTCQLTRSKAVRSRCSLKNVPCQVRISSDAAVYGLGLGNQFPLRGALVFKPLLLPWLGLRVLSALLGLRHALRWASAAVWTACSAYGNISYCDISRTRARDSDEMVLTGPS
jgi:hypothetical protein